MSSLSHLRSIHPKISSMPRQQSEALTHLEVYKMSVEKQRLEKELQNLKNREQKIIQRLAKIEQEKEKLLSTVQSSESSSSQKPTIKETSNSLKSAFDFDQVYVEY